MRYKEFKEQIENWGQKHGYVTEVRIEKFHTDMKVEFSGRFGFNAHISNIHRFVLDTNWKYFKEIEEHAREELFDTIVELAKTPIEDRKDEKEIQTNAEDVMNWKYIVGKGIWI